MLSVFQFHHVEPKLKSFTIGGKNMRQKTMAELRREVKKCKVVCCRCHLEIHWED